MTGTATEARIAPIEPPYDADTEARLMKWMPPGSGVEPLVLFRTLFAHPELASRMRPLGAAILGHGLIAAREREIVILRTCARCGAEYEWGVHVAAFSAAVGLSEDQVRATAVGAGDDRVWSERDRLLIGLADQLYETNDIDDALWAGLAGLFSEAELMELLVMAGWYRALSYVMNAARIPLESWAARFPEA